MRVVLGPYMQYCPCEALEQKLVQKPKSVLKGIKLSYCHHSMAYFSPIDGHFCQIVRYGLQPYLIILILAQIFFGGLNQKSAQLVCAKSIFTLILKVLDKFIEKCRRSGLFGE